MCFLSVFSVCVFCVFSLCVFSLCFLSVLSVGFLSVFSLCVFCLCFLPVCFLSVFLIRLRLSPHYQNDTFLSINFDIILLWSGLADHKAIICRYKYYQRLVVS